MPKIKLKITGDKKVILNLVKKYPARLTASLESALLEGIEEAKKQAIPLTPFDTRDLRKSIRTEVDKRRLIFAIVAGSSEVPYARFQEFGTLENRINPDNVKVLRALLKTGVSVKKGKGISPSLFLHRGVEKARPRIKMIMEEKIRRVIKRIR